MQISDALMQAVVALVMEAGAAILPYWKTNTEVSQKPDNSPVTAADLAAHHVLSQGLQRIAPEIPVLSEEDCAIALSERQQWQRWWLVDPLDGTKEFINGSDEFTVNVALIEQGQVVFGVVGVPVRQQCFYGGAELGAWLIEQQSSPQPIKVRNSPETLTVVASRRHSSALQEQLLATLKQQFAVELANIGSSLKFCLLAQGLVDFYPRLAPTSQWDTAAAQAVVEGAGGVVLQLDGSRFNYPAKASLLNPYFMALAKDAPWFASLRPLLAQTKA